MDTAKIITLIGVLVALGQVILAQLSYWEARQIASHFSTVKQTSIIYKTNLNFKLNNSLYSSNKIWELSLLTLFLYGIFGFGFAASRASSWGWALAILINYWNLANLKQRRFCDRHKNYLVKTLLAAHIMPSAVSIAGIVWASIQNLPIYLPVALGLATGINSVVTMAIFTESFGRSKAVTLATGLSYSGFILGWMVQNVSL